MTTYNTGNPIGSAAVKDLYDNAQNFDYYVNSSLTTYNDRFGVPRMTVYGFNVKLSAILVATTTRVNKIVADYQAQIITQEKQFQANEDTRAEAFSASLDQQKTRVDTFIQNSGYQVIGEYTAGPLTLTEYNQVISYNGALYKLRASTGVSYTTQGNTATSWLSLDSAKFFTIGDSEFRQELIAPNGGSLVGYRYGEGYPSESMGAKLDTFINVEDFADANSAVGDWRTAMQKAFDEAAATQKPLYGYGHYAVSGYVVLRNVGSKGVKIWLNKVSITAAFPAATSFWDATPIIVIGDGNSNFSGVDLFINTLYGANPTTGEIQADGIIPYDRGFGTGHIHIGSCQGCHAGIRTGSHTWPNASNVISGDFWTNNTVGIYLQGGSSGTTPIVEGWKIQVKFMAANEWAGIWFRNGGQYAQLNYDWDYSGGKVGILRLTDTTGLSTLALKGGVAGIDSTGKNVPGKCILTDGTTELEYLFNYEYQGSTYVAVAGTSNYRKDDSTSVAFQWATGSTITAPAFPDVAIVFDAVEVCADNTAKTNFFDAFFDFQYTAFGRIQMVAGYAAGIRGASKHSSTLLYQNGSDGGTNSIQGMGISNSGTTLALYNRAIEDTPFVQVTRELVGFSKRIYLGNNRLVGVNTVAALPVETAGTTWRSLLNLADTDTDKYLSEGSNWHVKIVTNYQGVYGEFKVNLKSLGTANMFARRRGANVFGFRIIQTLNSDASAVTGLSLQIRNGSPNILQFSITSTRDV